MLGLLPNALYTIHQGINAPEYLSPRLWSCALGSSLAPDGFGNANAFGDDFLNFGAVNPAISGTTSGVTGGYGYYVDTATSASSITQAAASDGVIEITTGATDDHEAWLTSGGNTGTLGAMDPTAGSDRLTVFEARVKVDQITSGNMFVGLSEEGLAAANTITDGNNIANKDLFGFLALGSDPDALTFTYKKENNTTVTLISDLATLAADTWVKLGFIYDPSRPTSEKVRIFVNNEEQATKITGTDMAAATWPDGQMAFLAGVKNGAAAAKTMSIDWWQFLQLAAK